MRRQRVDCLVLAVVMAAAATTARAQVPGKPAPIMGTLDFIGGEMALGAVVKGAPFSAEAVTTTSQILADGTRIERRVTAKLYRDSEGRVRREQTVLGLGALDPSADAQPMITISDPVSGVAYVLEPSTRTARRGRRISIERRGDVNAVQLEKLRAAARERLGEPGPPPPPPPPPPGERGTPSAAAREHIANWPQPLGTRQIEGVSATGTRRTETIPAGRIGNDRPIMITDERWESPDLKVLLMSQHHDPRTGDVDYRLTNISRAEPAHDLFMVPADYDIVNVPPPGPRE